MTFLVIFACLIAERFLLRYQSLRQNRWFWRWFDLQQSLPVSRVLREGRLGLLLLLLPPLLGVALVQTFLDGMLLGIPGLLFAALVLLYSLGPEDLDSQVAAWVQAGGIGNQAASRTFAAALSGTPEKSDNPELGALTDGVLSAALHRSLAVLFWFLLLGPLGALAYRLSRESRGLALEHSRQGLSEAIGVLLSVLDWLPARLLAGLFALGGCFDSAVQGWRRCYPVTDPDPNAALVGCVGRGALQGGEPSNEQVEAAMALVWRALVIFVALLGLITISGWIL